MSGRGKRRNRSNRRTWTVIAILVAALAVGGLAIFLTDNSSPGTSTVSSSATSSSSSSSVKPVILYVNQGNGAVNESNFGTMLSFASSHGFNTIFFQVYRSGSLLFDDQQLSSFVAQARAEGMGFFFSLYFTNSSQEIPTQVYGLNESGISLDMSTLSLTSQSALFDQLRQSYTGETAITTTDFSLALTPNLLVLETYGTQYQQYIRPGVIGSVGVFATTSRADYEGQLQYARDHGDGVMVFDYAGLIKSGY